MSVTACVHICFVTHTHSHLFEEQSSKVSGSVKADHAAIKIVFLPFQSFPFVIVDCRYLCLQLRATILEFLYEGVNCGGVEGLRAGRLEGEGQRE